MPPLTRSSANEPVAIIGTACHFAGGINSPSKLWNLLHNPTDVRSEITGSRFSAKGFYHPNHAHHGHSNVMHSYLIEDDVRAFDAEFFGINPVEAGAIDPQQRMLMETVYEAIEEAGLSIESLKNSNTGVFVGAMCADYEALQLRDLDAMPTYFATGTARSILSNRISYFFDWHGPCMTIDSACSSSLVAVHQAMKALRSGESRMVVACGSNIILGPENYIMESKLRMLSPDGLGRMWDKDANGYARGDGVATLVLKTLSSAIADKDHIESVIIETGVNHDGATPGITLPSATAQQALIENTYAAAGLDLSQITDRPQFFEAHGTGTSAGDSIEAEAVCNAFFGVEKMLNLNNDPLYVGSIKTILGHTEGTAGIAAILRASLAIQHGRVPPNLLFESISPTVAPFYRNLEIPKVAKLWPEVTGAPKRASVNSFGFGGTNAHAILESYEAEKSQNNITCTSSPVFTPFVFSAKTEKSLRANLEVFAAHLALRKYSLYDSHNLAYTLRERRSVFQYRAAYASSPSLSLEGIKTAILTSLENEAEPIGVKAQARIIRGEEIFKLLGVFTGQGAQYARMGASLIEQSPLAAQIIEKLESYLSQLPDVDRPIWSLRSELLASSSRIHEAAISQPLCTAVQILLVDLLSLANIRFDAVIGHSSGEISAAYAAGYLTARDAIIIAYYRGLHCRHAASLSGTIKGAMLAIETSWEDATQLCEDEVFVGRICVAACNSASSITISGDEDAIEQLEAVMDDEKKFSRRLKVDQAYHSSHMLPCFDPYLKSLHRANVRVQAPAFDKRTLWYSSVYDGGVMGADIKLSNEYWADNMVRPVLFHQTLTAILLDQGVFDVVLEVGAHPALRGPSTQSISNTLQLNVPYHGTLDRRMDSVQAMSTCLGFLWSNVGKCSVDLRAYEIAIAGRGENFKLVKSLPSYQWNHDIYHWHESRVSRRLRLRNEPFHVLLGHKSPDSAPYHLRWKNILKPSEIGWLSGHQVQGQVVFPAAGYVCTALEASQLLAGENEVQLVELSDFLIYQAIAFEDNDSAVETLIELSHVTRDDSGILRAKFFYSAALGISPSDLTLVAEGEVRVILGSASLDTLPERGDPTPQLIDVEAHRHYKFMEGLGYDFSGHFRSLRTIRRKLGRASCELSVPAIDKDMETMLLHPADVDGALQSIMLAYSYPGDDQLRTLHLPASISKIRVNPKLCAMRKGGKVPLDLAEVTLAVDSTCHRADRATPSSGFSGHVNLYISGYPSVALQVYGAKFIPFAGAVNTDRKVFYKTDWILEEPDGGLAASGINVTQGDTNLFSVLSRIASFYLRQFDKLPANHPARKEHSGDLFHYLNYAHHMTSLLMSGKHRYANREWATDTWDDVMGYMKQLRCGDDTTVKMMLLVGKTMPRVFNQETTMLEHLRTSGLLDEYYTYGFGVRQSSLWLGHIVKQISDRHPHMDILEIGAGTGAATKSILKEVDQSFNSYTFTDISSSFFENAAENLAAWGDRIVFKVYDAEREAAEQGFADGKYDVLIASLVIHATAQLSKTLSNLRKLLKPGGYLVVGEGVSDGPLQSGDGFLFGAVTGWWLGVDEGRTLSPFISISQWDDLLKNTGFSGIDTLAPSVVSETFGVALFVSQAVDNRINLLREPLTISEHQTTAVQHTKITKLVIVGGVTEPVMTLASKLETILQDFVTHLVFYPTLEDVDYAVVDETSTVLCLAEIDMPVFKNMTEEIWYSFRTMFETGKNLLWVSIGRLADEPWSNMPIGFGRTASNEASDLCVQFLDFPAVGCLDARTIAESLLRIQAKDQIDEDLLWTFEPELVVNTVGRLLVPRLSPITEANDRYNSNQHSTTRAINMETSVLELHVNTNHCTVTQLSRYDTAEETGQEIINLQTKFTVLSALRTEVGHQFLASAVDSDGRQYLALVPRALSILNIARQCAMPCNRWKPGLSEAGFLTAVAAHMVSLVVIEPVFPGQTILLHNVPPFIVHAIKFQASLKDIEVVLTSELSKSPATTGLGSAISDFISRSELSRLLPTNIAFFLGLSNKDQSESEETIISNLSHHCHHETASSIYSIDAIDVGSLPALILTKILKKAIQFAQEANIPDLPGTGEIVSLGILATGKRPENPIAIVDWTPQASLSVQVTRLDTQPLFKAWKTYWVCGMSSALGISLCDWMIDRGVKYLVITSRNPKIEYSWLEDHKRNGIIVEILSCDVTDEGALRGIYEKITTTMPPIAGVMNGAMVLRDSSIPNMQYDQLMDVTRPKVLGSQNLDRIFYDINLDFFILISSITCVVGNVGQANYAAANTYMCSLAANRRNRGLNSSVVNGGAIIGAGYITRETDRALDITVEKMALMHLSEEDFHQMIAEAIEAGYLDSPNGPEITTGLLDISPDSPHIPKWYSNPKLSRFIVHQNASNEVRQGQTATASIQDQLQNCETMPGLILLVKQSFGNQLRKFLQASDIMSNEVLFSKQAPELGLDSLISVDMRTWLLKNFKVSIPVLKIMGNDTMASLVQSVIEAIPAEMIPLVHTSTGDELAASTNPSRVNGFDTSAKSQISSSSTICEPIDWEAESTPPVDFVNISKLSSSPPANPPKVIVITGVTGLLGHHLLDRLLKNTTIETIHCLAIRKLEIRLQNQKLHLNPRIKYHQGDLSEPLLGLSQQEADAIFSQADAVIHNGADTSHVKLYSDLRASNVCATVDLTRLCLPRQIPLHYISSAGVAIYYGKDAFPEVSVAWPGSLYPAVDGSFGYGASKWTNERFLEKTHEKHNLSVCIYRPSSIIREGVDNSTSQAQLDWVNALLLYIRKVKAAPKVVHNHGVLDLVRVETCCADVVNHALSGVPRKELKYLNQIGDLVIPMDQMHLIDSDKGEKYDMLSFDEWIPMAIEAGLHPSVAQLIRDLDMPNMPSYPRLLKGGGK